MELADPFSEAGKRVIQALQTDPRLRALKAKIPDWDDPNHPGSFDWEPTSDLCPFVAVLPEDTQIDPLSPGLHESDWLLSIHIATRGLLRSDFFNLWHAVRGALFPPLGSARYAAVENLMEKGRIIARRISQVPGPRQPAAGGDLLYGSGGIVTNLHISTGE